MTRFALFSALILAFACGDDDDAVTDDPAEDASVTDAGGATDGGRDIDAGSDPTDAGADPADASMSSDAATPSDAAASTDAAPEPDLGASPCDGQTIGAPCRDRCPGGYDCVDGACLPGSMRAGCGGFAGAMCTTRAFPNCAYYSGSDYGPCLSEEELACACSVLTDLFDCPRRD